MWDPREDSYIQDLAARIEALEAAQQPAPATEESSATAPPAPAGGLVERVAKALAEVNSCSSPEIWLFDACAAIRVIAAWLEQQQEVPVGSASASADYFAAMLRSEANR